MAYRGPKLSAVWVLIIINLLLFVATIIEEDLILRLGLQPASFSDRPWTLVTNLFIHGSFWHILFNMLTFYFFGSYLNRLLGTKRLLIAYFSGGIAGNLLYLLLATSQYAVAVGASGAIFALGGVLTVMRPRLRVFVFPIPVPIPLWIAIIGGFIIISFFPNVAWQAHLGGLVVGLVAGYIFRKRARYVYY